MRGNFPKRMLDIKKYKEDFDKFEAAFTEALEFMRTQIKEQSLEVKSDDAIEANEE